MQSLIPDYTPRCNNHQCYKRHTCGRFKQYLKDDPIDRRKHFVTIKYIADGCKNHIVNTK